MDRNGLNRCIDFGLIGLIGLIRLIRPPNLLTYWPVDSLTR